MHLSAPAKINLHLHVGPKRDDGYHPLLSWMCTVSLFDNLSISRHAGGEVMLTCNRPELPCDERNLVLRAAGLLRQAGSRLGRPGLPGVSMHLEKRIPIGAGLGGGSSDAACALRGLNRFWGLSLPEVALSELAGRLGSDVPFFLGSGSSICRGRGEIIEPAERPAARWALLIMPDFALSTAEVYQQFDRMGEGDIASDGGANSWEAAAGAALPEMRRWAALNAEELLPRLRNDLEPAAFDLRPELAGLHQRAEQLAGRPVRMSGSGSSLFTVYDSEEECEKSASLVSAEAEVRALTVALAPEIESGINAGPSSG